MERCEDFDFFDTFAATVAETFVLYFCGEDCVVRRTLGLAPVAAVLELQAAGNLRQSYAVVGIFPRYDDFFQMIGARFSYFDATLVEKLDRPPEARDGAGAELQRHLRCAPRRRLPTAAGRSRAGGGRRACASDVAVEVNAAQRELAACPKKPAAEKPAAKKPAGGARKRRPLPYDAQGKPAAKKPAAKKPAAKKPAAKKPAAKKPAAKSPRPRSPRPRSPRPMLGT
ncbi:hypothetical protein JL722_4256 [Aureococcus anophagefferens]|nr:hypothetical protein JL722_4256 [Aureococcus anophagefferens]